MNTENTQDPSVLAPGTEIAAVIHDGDYKIRPLFFPIELWKHYGVWKHDV